MRLKHQTTKCNYTINNSGDCMSNPDKYTQTSLSNPCSCGYNNDAQAYCFLSTEIIRENN